MGINFANVTTGSSGEGDGTFKPLEEGRYTVLVEEAKSGTSQAGNEKLSITLKVMEGTYKGRKLWADFAITDKALVFLKYFLEAVGSKHANDGNAEIKDLVIDVKNKQCSVWVAIGQTNTGKPKNIVSLFKPIDGAADVADTSETADAGSGDGNKKAMFK